MQFTRGASALAATALLVTGLSACGEDSDEPPITLSSSSDDSTTSSSSSSSSSSSASGSSTSSDVDLPDDIPAAALENTKAGAAAFGEYYILTYGEAAKTADTRALESMASPDCAVCNTAVKDIESDKAKGWTKDRNPYTVGNVKATKRPDEGYKVAMDVKVATHNRVDSSGEANGQVSAIQYELTEHLVWDHGRWQVKDWIVT